MPVPPRQHSRLVHNLLVPRLCLRTSSESCKGHLVWKPVELSFNRLPENQTKRILQNTRLVKFLQTLSNAEVKNFRDLVNSPIYNKNKQVAGLLDLMIEHYPAFDDPDLTEMDLFRKLYGNSKYEYFTMKNLISDLLGLGKELLIFNAFRKDANSREIYLLRELAGRGLEQMFEAAYRSAEKRLENSDVHDENYLYHKYRLTDQLMTYNTPKNPNVNFHFHQETLDLFVDYSNLKKLKIYNVMLHEGNQNNYKYDLTMFKQVMEHIDVSPSSDNPTIAVYRDIIRLCLEKNDVNFLKLKSTHEKLKGNLGIVDDYMAFLHLDSYCATAYNIHGRTDLLPMQFELNKIYDMNNLPELGTILYPNFLNFVKIASRVNEFAYAEEYIEKYSRNLTSERKNTVDFSYAYIAYRKGEYEKALTLLARTNFSNFIIKLQVKLLQLQINFQLGYFEQVTLMTDSFRHYLSREKMILEIHRDVILQFLKITGDMVRLVTDPQCRKKPMVNEIRFQIEKLKTNHFGIKLWLLEQSEKL